VVVAAEAEAAQDRTAGKNSIKSKRKKSARRAGFFLFVSVHGIP
jgi:hypothetical protein